MPREIDLPILICAKGERHRKEAEAFISRHPRLRIFVASDRHLPGAAGHVPISTEGYLSKIEAIIKFNFDQFLYVDTDVTIFSMEDVPFFLDRYSISASYEPLGSSEKFKEYDLPVEDTAPFEYQTGVLAVKKTVAAMNFL